MSEECVKVFVRVRPLTQKQKTRKNVDFMHCDQTDKQITLENHVHENQSKKIFCFDDLFLQHSTQEEVYERTGEKLVHEVMQGYNGTIFAYGQTGSGKTFTMMGNSKVSDQVGIIPRCFSSILNKAKSTNCKDFLVMCSFVELYNEQIRDLLNHNPKTKLQLRQSPENGVFIKDVRKIAVTSEEQMHKYLKIGNNNRSIGETMMNLESSRSHSIFTIYVQSLEKNQGKQKLIGSKFNLVDLAGSQRLNKTGSTGDRFVEATKINLSLTALGKVITSLVKGKGSFVPYRDSKLTRLLQDSLGGNAKTIMVATISPAFYNYEETVSTLKYASRAKYITNEPVINRDPKDALILQYESEIKRLRGMLKDIQKDEKPQIHQLKQENEKLARLAEQQKKELMTKIKALQEQFIYPTQLSQKLLNERQRRQQKLSFMEKNYRNLQEQVKQMRQLLSQLRRKYKNASKQICEMENEHEKQREKIEEQYESIKKQCIMFKSVLSILFTPKQLNNLISLGTWEDEETFKLPTFYFKDRHTLAFPCNSEEGGQKEHNNREKQNLVKKSLQKDRSTQQSSTNGFRSGSKNMYRRR